MRLTLVCVTAARLPYTMVTAERAESSPGQPLSWSQIVEKFDDCLDSAGGAVPASRARHAVELVRDLERLTDVRELIALFA